MFLVYIITYEKIFIMKIVDNFLPREDHLKILNCLEDSHFPWFFNKEKDSPEKAHLITQFQFVHSFFRGTEKSIFYPHIVPILSLLKPRILIRAKANLNPYSQKLVEGEFHKDHSIKQVTVAIYYVNSNDGYTVIKTKNKLEKVDSIANRLVVFSSSLSHKGTNSTNCKNRMVINFNYIK